MASRFVFNAAWSTGLNELLTAAVVNEPFRRLLLTDAEEALRQGYHGRVLALTAQERAQVLAIQADTFTDFVMQLAEAKQDVTLDGRDRLNDITFYRL